MNGKSNYTPDPKPTKRPRKQIRVIDKDATKRKLLRDSGCREEGCQKLATQGHHIVRRGAPHFGDDVEDNILPLCTESHTDFHSGKNPSFRFEQAEYDYVTGKLGEEPGMVFLLRHYGKSIA